MILSVLNLKVQQQICYPENNMHISESQKLMLYLIKFQMALEKFIRLQDLFKSTTRWGSCQGFVTWSTTLARQIIWIRQATKGVLSRILPRLLPLHFYYSPILWPHLLQWWRDEDIFVYLVLQVLIKHTLRLFGSL